MVKSKTELFAAEIRDCAELFKALSYPARIAILKYIKGSRVCITGDISNELPLRRSTVNQHLSELKKAGRIRGTDETIAAWVIRGYGNTGELLLTDRCQKTSLMKRKDMTRPVRPSI